MQKLGFPTLKSLDQLRSFKMPLSGTGRASPIVIPSPPPADSINYGSFATLKRTAEKLIQEQASVKIDLEMAVSEMLETGKAMLSNLSQQFEERLIVTLSSTHALLLSCRTLNSTYFRVSLKRTLEFLKTFRILAVTVEFPPNSIMQWNVPRLLLIYFRL